MVFTGFGPPHMIFPTWVALFHLLQMEPHWLPFLSPYLWDGKLHLHSFAPSLKPSWILPIEPTSHSQLTSHTTWSSRPTSPLRLHLHMTQLPRKYMDNHLQLPRTPLSSQLPPPRKLIQVMPPIFSLPQFIVAPLHLIRHASGSHDWKPLMSTWMILLVSPKAHSQSDSMHIANFFTVLIKFCALFTALTTSTAKSLSWSKNSSKEMPTGLPKKRFWAGMLTQSRRWSPCPPPVYSNTCSKFWMTYWQPRKGSP